MALADHIAILTIFVPFIAAMLIPADASGWVDDTALEEQQTRDSDDR